MSGLLRCSRGHARKQVKLKRDWPRKSSGVSPSVVHIGFDGVAPQSPCLCGPMASLAGHACWMDHFGLIFEPVLVR